MKVENKTECEIVQDLLIGYSDNVLNPESKKLVEKHLVECGNCRERLKEMEKDAKDNENNQKKQIDYLKKVRLKNRIKSILFVVILIVLILFGYYLYKFSILNGISNKASKQFETKNFYIEKVNKMGFSDDELTVEKTWYKDGKYKTIYACRKEDRRENDEIISCSYGNINENASQQYFVYEQEKKVEKTIWLFDKGIDTITNLPNPIIPSFNNNYMMRILGAPFYNKISTSYKNVGRKYYVIESGDVTTWVDIDTGLPIMRFGESTITTYFNNTMIPKQSEDSVTQYFYEFNVVTDNDVEMPDFTGYEITEYNYKEEVKEMVEESGKEG